MELQGRQTQSVKANAFRYKRIAWCIVACVLMFGANIYLNHEKSWLQSVGGTTCMIVTFVGFYTLLSLYLYKSKHQQNRRAFTVLFATFVGLYLGIIAIAVYLNIFLPVLIRWAKMIRVLWLSVQN